MPLHAEKETAMQIDDKSVLENLEDAVSLATVQLKLAPSVLFQAKAVSLIEDIFNHKNVIKIKFKKKRINLIKINLFLIIVSCGWQKWLRSKLITSLDTISFTLILFLFN